MPHGFKIFEDFESGKYIHQDDLRYLTDHICGNLNNWTSNYSFWYYMYSYSSKAYIVCRWRQSKGTLFVYGGNQKVYHRLQNGVKLFARTN